MYVAISEVNKDNFLFISPSEIWITSLNSILDVWPIIRMEELHFKLLHFKYHYFIFDQLEDTSYSKNAIKYTTESFSQACIAKIRSHYGNNEYYFLTVIHVIET